MALARFFARRSSDTSNSTEKPSLFSRHRRSSAVSSDSYLDLIERCRVKLKTMEDKFKDATSQAHLKIYSDASVILSGMLIKSADEAEFKQHQQAAFKAALAAHSSKKNSAEPPISHHWLPFILFDKSDPIFASEKNSAEPPISHHWLPFMQEIFDKSDPIFALAFKPMVATLAEEIATTEGISNKKDLESTVKLLSIPGGPEGIFDLNTRNNIAQLMALRAEEKTKNLVIDFKKSLTVDELKNSMNSLNSEKSTTQFTDAIEKLSDKDLFNLTHTVMLYQQAQSNDAILRSSPICSQLYAAYARKTKFTFADGEMTEQFAILNAIVYKVQSKMPKAGAQGSPHERAANEILFQLRAQQGGASSQQIAALKALADEVNNIEQEITNSASVNNRRGIR